MNNYVKIVYQSEPIGKERIILYLTTFDLEAFEKDQLIEKTKKVAFDVSKQDLSTNAGIEHLENMLDDYVKKYYGHYVDKLKELINTKKNMDRVIDLNAKNITNSDNVHCGVVYGNITNCDNIYCTEIKGNVVNCDKIIYK